MLEGWRLLRPGGLPAVLWILIRMLLSVWIRIRIRIQESKNDPQKKKKKFHVLLFLIFSLERAEGFPVAWTFFVEA
jgi:hypothetical protein